MKKNEPKQSGMKVPDAMGAKEMVTVVTATMADVYPLVALDEELFDVDVRYDAETFLVYVLSSGADVRLAISAEGLVGCAIVGYDHFADAASGALLVTINVALRWQRRGVGSLLITDAMARARERGEARLTLQVATDNEGARVFYERYGFNLVERLDGYYGERGDAFSMTKRL